VSDRQNFGHERDLPARSDAQPQIEIFAGEKRFIEQADIFETTAPNNNGRSEDKAISNQALKQPAGVWRADCGKQAAALSRRFADPAQ
jgi:hypothetical protein